LQNPVTKVGAESLLFDDIDGESQELFHVLLQRDEVEKVSAGFEDHKEVDVA
jgi:hypothetical protein